MTGNDRIAWSDFYKICVGMMSMRPIDFWQLSPREVYLAITGFKQFNSPSEDDKPEPMTSDRMKELMELYPD